MAEVVGIRFKENGKVYFFDPDGKEFSKSEKVIVETVRGIECGEVSSPNHKVNDDDIVHPLKKVIRAANKEDIKIVEQNKKKEEEAFGICLRDKLLRHIGRLKGHEEVLLYVANLRFDSSDIVIKHHADILFIRHRNSDDSLCLASNSVAEVTAVNGSELESDWRLAIGNEAIEETHENLIGIATTFINVIT